jgi:chromosome partitioning protein
MMDATPELQANTASSISNYIKEQSERLSYALDKHMQDTFVPEKKKVLRKFPLSEVSELIGTSTSNIRKLHSDGSIPEVESDARGRRYYTASEMHNLRNYLAETARSPAPFKPGKWTSDDHTQVLVFANFKGGAAKTTSAAHTSNRLANRGYRVLCIDMDPQGSLTTNFGYRPEIHFRENGTIYDVLSYTDPVGMKDVIRKTYYPNLDLIPAGILLSEYETETALALTKGMSGELPFYVRLKAAIETIEDDYDVIIIDCPPQIGFLTLTALCAATGVLTTIHPSMYDVASMAQFQLLSSNLLATIEESGLSLDWDFMQYVITKYEPSKSTQTQIAGFLRMTMGGAVLNHEFLNSEAVSNAAAQQKTIYEVEPVTQGRKTLERAIQSFNSVITEIEALIQKSWGRDPAEMLKGRI